MIEEGKFDATLKSALEGLQVPYDPASWDQLEQRIAQMPKTDGQAPGMDQHFRQVLQGLEVPYHSGHWDLMADRIVREQRMRRRIWITKFAEAAVFLLLVANLDGLLGGINAAATDSNTAGPSSSTPFAAAGLSQSTNHSGKTAGITTLASDQTSMATGFWSEDNVSTQFVDIFEMGNAVSGYMEENPALFGVNPGFEVASQPVLALNTDASAISVLDPIPVLQQGNALSATFAFAGLPQGVHQKVAKQRNFYALAFLGSDQNQIHEGNDLRKANGVKGGIGIGYRKGKWGVETGIAYAKKVFQPKRKIEIYAGNTSGGYYGTYVDQVSADVVAVPVHVTHRLGRVGRVSLQAVAGSTAHFAVQKAFKYQTVFYPGLSQNPDPNGNKPPVIQASGDGIFEKGSVNENFYASVDAGIRLERPLGKSFAVYLAPMVQTTLTKRGIGPGPSKINTISLQAGVIAAL